MILNVYIDDETADRLARAADSLGRTITDLAESAVAEAANDWQRTQPVIKDSADGAPKTDL